MKVLLINPRGRLVEINDRELNVSNLLQQGFTYPPSGLEGGKVYNPVFDRGKDIEPVIPDNRVEIASISGDTLRVVKV
jgi:hypothetical protein